MDSNWLGVTGGFAWNGPACLRSLLLTQPNSSGLRLNELPDTLACMVHGYHVILTAYGFWLPNDPRGSWSDFVGKWELVKFGRSTKGRDFRHLTDLTADEHHQRDVARRSLKYPAVRFSDAQVAAIAQGLAVACANYGYRIWACSILPEHAHLVVARHRYKAEFVANKMKASTTRQLLDQRLHPLAQYAEPGKRPPRMWAERQWISFLDSEMAIDDAISYVIANPDKEGKPIQSWDVVIPFAGLDKGWTTYLD